MAHGTPDWGVQATKTTIFRMDDIGEAAARLGSIVSYERRGDVIFLDDFELGLGRWTVLENDVADAVSIVTSSARSGTQSCSLANGAGGAALTSIQKAIPLVNASLLGLEVHAAFTQATDEFWIALGVDDGTNIHTFTMKYDDANNEIAIRTGAVTFSTFLESVTLEREANFFHAFKLVVNPATGQYVRLQIDNVVHDISAFSFAPAGSSDPGRLNINILHFGDGGGNEIVFVDDVIVTINEPA